MERVIEPEWLDVLPADDPRARRSRGDLRRLNWLMNNAGLVARALRNSPPPQRALDIGAGDGRFALALAQRCGWRGTEFILVDRVGDLPAAVRSGFQALQCRVQFCQRDVLSGLGEIPPVDVAWVNLFLHHFQDGQLASLLAEAAVRCRTFVACEPRRNLFALLASRCLALIGCNDVTRHDAVASVRAGFRDGEVSRLWPGSEGWSVGEGSAGWFSHLFVARRL